MGGLENILSQLIQIYKDKTNILSSYAESSLYIHMYISGNKVGYLYSHLY